MSRHLRPILALLALVLPACSLGCSILATGLWVLNPNDTAAEYEGLRDKRVVVVCRATGGSQEAAGSTHEIARNVAALLKENVWRIKLVSQKDVNDWLDNNEMKSYQDLGKALRADKVVAVDLTQMSLYDGQTLYQGRAQANITVFDIQTEESDELHPFDVRYPPKNGVPADIPERQFRAKFLEIMCQQIARRFYAFDSRAVDDYYYSETWQYGNH